MISEDLKLLNVDSLVQIILDQEKERVLLEEENKELTMLCGMKDEELQKMNDLLERWHKCGEVYFSDLHKKMSTCFQELLKLQSTQEGLESDNSSLKNTLGQLLMRLEAPRKNGDGSSSPSLSIDNSKGFHQELSPSLQENNFSAFKSNSTQSLKPVHLQQLRNKMEEEIKKQLFHQKTPDYYLPLNDTNQNKMPNNFRKNISLSSLPSNSETNSNNNNNNNNNNNSTYKQQNSQNPNPSFPQTNLNKHHSISNPLISKQPQFTLPSQNYDYNNNKNNRNIINNNNNYNNNNDNYPKNNNFFKPINDRMSDSSNPSDQMYPYKPRTPSSSSTLTSLSSKQENIQGRLSNKQQLLFQKQQPISYQQQKTLSQSNEIHSRLKQSQTPQPQSELRQAHQSKTQQPSLGNLGNQNQLNQLQIKKYPRYNGDQLNNNNNNNNLLNNNYQNFPSNNNINYLYNSNLNLSNNKNPSSLRSQSTVPLSALDRRIPQKVRFSRDEEEKIQLRQSCNALWKKMNNQPSKII